MRTIVLPKISLDPKEVSWELLAWIQPEQH